jgi:sialate O-acetylesterase
MILRDYNRTPTGSVAKNFAHGAIVSPSDLHRGVLPMLLMFFVTAANLPLQALELPSIFSDHMVLQQGQPLPVWGKAEPGAKVTIAFGKQSVEDVADSEGNWMAALASENASETPAQLKVRSGEKEAVFEDVLVGEVWLCSGQSNMQIQIRESLNPDIFALAGVDPLLRFYTVDRIASPNLRFSANSKWVTATPATINDFSAVGFHFGAVLRRTLNVPVGLIHASWGETPAIAWTRPVVLDKHPLFIAMVNEWEKGMKTFPERNAVYLAKCAEWNKSKGFQPDAKVNHWSNPGAPKPPPYDPEGSKRPGNLANSMLGPVAPFAIRGVIWYQGENDTNWFPGQYDERLHLMVDDWRVWWNNPELFFGVVQLASHGQPNDKSKDNEWAALRESQRRFVAKDPHAGLAIAMDVGEANNIHPFDKQTVGQRLARRALTDIYKKMSLRGGPEPVEATFDDAASIRFESVGSGLWVLNGGPLEGFTIAGVDGVFHPAKAEIKGKDSVLVTSPQVPAPQAVRYAWARNTLGANLTNKQRLPAGTFEMKKSGAVTNP